MHGSGPFRRSLPVYCPRARSREPDAVSQVMDRPEVLKAGALGSGDPPMNAGFDRIVIRSFAGFGAFLAHFGRTGGFSLGRRLLWLPTAVLVGGGVWTLVPASNGHVVRGGPPRVELATLQPEAPTAGPGEGAATTAARSAAPAKLDGLRISSQTWRRGGLGSKALVTFTLRNDNDYAVKDVEILCSFSRRDGSHLTDRTRVLPETVNMKSRKTFARVLVGFVNVNASRASCSLAAAQRG